MHFNIIGKANDTELRQSQNTKKWNEGLKVCAWLSLSCVGNFAEWLTAVVPYSKSQQRHKIITGLNVYVYKYILNKNYGTNMIFSKIL